MKDRFLGFISALGAVAMIALGIAQLVVASMWMGEFAGMYWTIGALIVVFMFRLTLLVVIGAFLGAYEVLGWHWALAGLFAVPGLLAIVPGVLALLVSALTRRGSSGASH